MKKNPDGIGHYYTKTVNNKKRYFWRISVNGNIIERSSYNRSDLDDKIKIVKKSITFGYDPAIKRLSDFSKMYLNVSTSHLKPRTKKWYESIIRLYLSSEPLGSKNIQDITPMDIESYLNTLKGKISASYINGIKRCLSVICNCAIKQGMLRQNPCSTAKTPKIKKRNVYIPSRMQIKDILAIAKSGEYLGKKVENENEGQTLMREQFYTVLLLALFTGLRRGETYALTWDNVDLEYGRIHIVVTLGKSDDSNEPTPKTLQSRRSISIPNNVLLALREWQNLQKHFSEKYGDIYDNKDNIVFPNTIGHYYNYSNINRSYWYPFRKYCGLPKDYHWHDFRHWHVTYLVSLQVKIGEITRRLGHSDPSITYRIYTHAFATDDSTLINAINNDWS